jgi:CubicO group peptidase (beta-lactamase class C family)
MIEGTVDPKFQKLKDAFASNFSDGPERGASFALMVDGKLVADLWGGHTDNAQTKPWRRNTLVNVWSCTKAIMAIAVAMEVERGRLHYDRPIREVWPEFAVNGKDEITLDLLLSHQGGLNGLNVPIDDAGLYAWTPYADALAAMAPLWKPGSRCVYHALTYGHLAGEPLRRVSGQSVGTYVRENIAAPLGVPFFIGLPEAEDHRVAEIVEGPKASDWVVATLASPYPNAGMNPTPVATAPNTRAWRAAEIPGGNGHTDARSLAAIYGNLVGGVAPLLSQQGLATATAIRFEGLDACSQTETCFSAGFRMLDPHYANRASSKTFGHAGWGGALGFADPEARLGFAYLTNYLLGFDDGIDVRRKRMIDAVYDLI